MDGNKMKASSGLLKNTNFHNLYRVCIVMLRVSVVKHNQVECWVATSACSEESELCYTRAGIVLCLCGDSIGVWTSSPPGSAVRPIRARQVEQDLEGSSLGRMGGEEINGFWADEVATMQLSKGPTRGRSNFTKLTSYMYLTRVS
ncbi:hypothetical protein RRG08_020102 [Elysia crispata]|uniref:Uncharacterized protein n=1 Tax=Elysia crispata TaxID=231223 RepID=A0AAE1A5R8_9GAST|nr:hypothetical protein RRG08_020102 [Elysia crispata]